MPVNKLTSENNNLKTPNCRWQLGEFVFDPTANELIGPQGSLAITAKMSDVLLLLIIANGEVVSKVEIYEQVWGDVQVSEQLIARAISDLRKALGDDAKDANYIQTLPKSGYRLVVPVTRIKKSVIPLKEPKSIHWLLLGLPLFLIVWIWYVLTEAPDSTQHTIPQLATPTPVSSEPGIENTPTISPDGKLMAYALKTSGDKFWQIQIKNRQTGSQRTLTNSSFDQFSPRFSPDGKQIAFTRYRFDETLSKEVCDLVLVYLESNEKRTYNNLCSARFYMSLDWSIDGQSLFFTLDVAQEKRGLAILNIKNGQTVTLTRPPEKGMSDYSPRISPNGKQLLFVRGQLKPSHHSSLMTAQLPSSPNNQADLQSLRDISPLTSRSVNIWGLAWKTDEQLFYVSHHGDYVGLRLFDLTNKSDVLLQKGELHRLDFHRPSSTLVFAKSNQVSDIYAVDLAAHLNLDQQTKSDATTSSLALNHATKKSAVVSTRHDRMPRLSNDGKQLAFVSEREGHPQIWLTTLATDNPRKLTSFPDLDIVDFSWSPDDKMLIANLRAEGKTYHYIVDIDAGNLNLMSTDNVEINGLRWSQQQSWMVGSCRLYNDWQICRVPSQGGKPEILTSAGGVTPYTPHQSDFIYFTRAGKGLWKMPLSGGSEELVWQDFPEHSWKNFVVYEHQLYYARKDAKREQMQLVKRDLFSSQESIVTNVGINWFDKSLDISTDGNTIMLSVLSVAKDDLYEMTVGD